MQQITIRDALQQWCRDIDDIDARILLQHVLNVSHAHLIAHAEQALDSKQAQSFRLLAERRARGEPVAYLIGKREFYSLDFKSPRQFSFLALKRNYWWIWLWREFRWTVPGKFLILGPAAALSR